LEKCNVFWYNTCSVWLRYQISATMSTFVLPIHFFSKISIPVPPKWTFQSMVSIGVFLKQFEKNRYQNFINWYYQQFQQIYDFIENKLMVSVVTTIDRFWFWPLLPTKHKQTQQGSFSFAKWKNILGTGIFLNVFIFSSLKWTIFFNSIYQISEQTKVAFN
jgi:hypothetical protein